LVFSIAILLSLGRRKSRKKNCSLSPLTTTFPFPIANRALHFTAPPSSPHQGPSTGTKVVALMPENWPLKSVYWVNAQVDVFAFETDAYLYLVDQAEGLTDAHRIELEQLAKLPDREAFWMLFNQCVSPITTYRIETQRQPNLFKA
jgi:hypothetical protein